MGPAQAIKTGLAKSFQIKAPKAMMLAFGCALIGSSTQTLWADNSSYSAPLEAAIELCLNVPPNRAELEETAIRAGWTLDNEALTKTMFSFLIISSWIDDNVSGGIQVGAFAATNVMRRPEMESSQPGFAFQDVSFSVVNIERANSAVPVCTLSGPLETEALFVTKLGLNASVSRPGYRRAETNLGGRQILFIVKDPLELDSVSEAFPGEESDEIMRAAITSRLKPVNLIIGQMRQ